METQGNAQRGRCLENHGLTLLRLYPFTHFNYETTDDSTMRIQREHFCR